MDLEKIQQVIDLMAENNLAEFQYEEHNKYKLVLKNSSAVAPAVMAAPAAAAPAPAAPAAPAESGIKTIDSPIVGTFYAAPSPEAPDYTKVGDSVSEESILCIVEAMKVMNEITAGVKGTITEILVENGAPVEYGQPLFKYKPE